MCWKGRVNFSDHLYPSSFAKASKLPVKATEPINRLEIRTITTIIWYSSGKLIHLLISAKDNNTAPSPPKQKLIPSEASMSFLFFLQLNIQ